MHILSIHTNKTHKSIPANFNSLLTGDMVIISGVNGSGKSHILEVISTNNASNGIANIEINGVQLKSKDVIIRSFKDNISVPEFTVQNPNTIMSNTGTIYNNYAKFLLDKNHNTLASHQIVASKCKEILIEKYGASKFDSKKITLEEIAGCEGLPLRKTDDVFTNFISDLFYEYANKIAVLEREYGNKKGIVDTASIQREAPWTKLNKVFKDLKLEYRFATDYEISRSTGIGMNKNVTLHPYIDGAIVDSQSRVISHLSDGEKAIIALAFSSVSGVSNQNKKVLLLDEFDATLNPSLTEIFYNMIEKYYIKQGIMVIIVTHSPVTISLAPDYAKFYEVFKPGNNNRILPVNKDEYKEMNKVFGDFYDQIKNESVRYTKLHEKYIELQEMTERLGDGVAPLIITEGKTDKIHIENAQEKLGITDLNVEYFDVPDDRGDSTLNEFLKKISILDHTRKIIGIFDRDNPQILSSIETGEDAIKEYGNNVYAFCIAAPIGREAYTNISIEFYYPDNLINKEKNGRALYFTNQVDHLHNKSINQSEIRKLETTDIRTTNEVNKKIFDEKRMCDVTTWIHSKTAFANAIVNDDEFCGEYDFTAFESIFNTIRSIVDDH